LKPANDNGRPASGPIDPRILLIARAIGRQIAREEMVALYAADNNGRDGEQ
jgi:hypothetical protein